jgi:Leucine-rich repeat (LRR) protein
LKCEIEKWNGDLTCDAKDLKIFTLNIKLREVHPSENNLEIAWLKIFHQDVMMLPINLKDFLPRLTKLTVCKSKLSYLSKKSLWNFRELNFSGNLINELPNHVFDNLQTLTYFDLGYSFIKLISITVFRQFSSLEVLLLRNNQIEALVDTLFDENNKLTLIDLSANQIKTIPTASFQHLPNLRVFYVNNNHLQILSKLVFSRPTNTEVLNFSHKNLEFIDTSLMTAASSSLKSVDFTNSNCVYIKYPSDVNLREMRREITKNCKESVWK